MILFNFIQSKKDLEEIQRLQLPEITEAMGIYVTSHAY